MTTQTELTLSELAIQQLNASRGLLTKLLDTLTYEQMMARAGEAGNHAAWIMGHLAVADDRFVSEFRNEDSRLPADYYKLFDSGSKPSSDEGDYPKRAELQRQFTAARDRTIEWAKTLEGDAAWQASPESIAAITPNAISALHTLAEHDLFHAGQVATIRAALNMPPVFM